MVTRPERNRGIWMPTRMHAAVRRDQGTAGKRLSEGARLQWEWDTFSGTAGVAGQGAKEAHPSFGTNHLSS